MIQGEFNMISEEAVIELATTRYKVTKIWKTCEWTVFQWDNCLYYVRNGQDVPDWKVGDEVTPLDVLWNKTRQDGCKFEMNRSNPVFEKGYKQGQADLLKELINKYIFGGEK